MALLISGFCTGISLAAFTYSLQQAMLPNSATSWVVVAVFGAFVVICAALCLFGLWAADHP